MQQQAEQWMQQLKLSVTLAELWRSELEQPLPRPEQLEQRPPRLRLA